MPIIDEHHCSQHGCDGPWIKIAGQQGSGAQDKYHHKRSNKGDAKQGEGCQPGQSRNSGGKRRDDRCKAKIIGHALAPAEAVKTGKPIAQYERQSATGNQGDRNKVDA